MAEQALTDALVLFDRVDAYYRSVGEEEWVPTETP